MSQVITVAGDRIQGAALAGLIGAVCTFNPMAMVWAGMGWHKAREVQTAQLA